MLSVYSVAVAHQEEWPMRFVLLAFALPVTLALPGCAASSASVRADQRKIASLQLFGGDAQPRFVAYLACSADTRDGIPQCRTVSNAFNAWANARSISLHVVEKDDPVFQSQPLPVSQNASSSKPYRVAVRFTPVVTPSYDEWHGSNGNLSSGFVAGKVGYEATVDVFSTATGALLDTFSRHEHQDMPQRANVTPVIREDTNALIEQIDPGYSR